ncbi:MAG: hypothetical protein HZA14_05260 [Nitrospirae bacterium]|nr:hypothetical protein [Nitrospirota bacterium]
MGCVPIFQRGDKQRASIIHDFVDRYISPFEIHTELGEDLDLGTFFLENRLEYLLDILQVDLKTLPENFTVPDFKKTLEILPGKEPQEIKLPPFHAIWQLVSRQ